jgi:ribosomal protein L11 methyltransferase
MDWTHVEVDVTGEVAEAAGAALIDAGATGVEERDLGDGTATVLAYFERPPDPEALGAALAAAPGVEAGRLSGLRFGSTPDADWLEVWKRGFEPVPVGERLLVVPSWRRDEADRFRGRAALEIDPGMAFGTGTHETTRLCLEWLDGAWHGGSLLDVGTGTGILAIAAALLAPGSRVVGVDVDPLAVDVARENLEINGLDGRVTLLVGDAVAIDERFDAVLANLTADVIVPSAAVLAARVAPGGTLVVSGILREQEHDVVRALEGAGLEIRDARRHGEWVALVGGPPSP